MIRHRSEIALRAARLVVEDGMDYGSAKRRAAQDSGVIERAMLPGNDELEDAVREYLDLFHADTQSATLPALRGLAMTWMQRFAEFRPHLAGPVWQGSANEKSGLQIELYCDDPKLAEIEMINRGLKGFSVQGSKFDNEDLLVYFVDRCDELKKDIDISVLIQDYDRLRGALRMDRQGRSRRGSLNQLQRLLDGARND